MKKLLELRFRAVDHCDVHDIFALKSALATGAGMAGPRVIGKVWDADEERLVCTGEDAVLRATVAECREDKTYFAKAVRLGELEVADKATAEFLGVPFASKPAPKSAAQSLTGGV